MVMNHRKQFVASKIDVFDKIVSTSHRRSVFTPLLRFLPLPDGVVSFLNYSFSTFCVIFIFLCDLQLLSIFSHLQPESANGAMV